VSRNETITTPTRLGTAISMRFAIILSMAAGDGFPN
jgi:hypothetical protein